MMSGANQNWKISKNRNTNFSTDNNAPLRTTEFVDTGHSNNFIEPIVEIKDEIKEDELSDTTSPDIKQRFNGIKIQDTGFIQMRQSINSVKTETAHQRSIRLARMSAYAASRLANETPNQRAKRLERMSKYAAKRLREETPEQRNKRLARMSAYAAKKLSEESPEQRRARLSRMSAYAAKRHKMKRMLEKSDGKIHSLISDYHNPYDLNCT